MLTSTPNPPSATTPAPRSRWTAHLPAILFLLAALYFLLRSHMYWAPRTVDVTALHLVELDGTPLPDAAVRGKPVVLNFWAPWCPPCRVELPRFQQLQHDHPGIAVIGLEDDPSDLDNARVLARSSGLTFPLVLPSTTTRHTLGHVAVLPTTLYISSSGRVVHTVTGLVPESTMNHYLADILPTP